MAYVHFYKPKSYSGLGRLIGWIICIFSRSYNHTDMSGETTAGEVVIAADIVEGKVTTWNRTPENAQPYASFHIPVGEYVFWRVANSFLGQPYSRNELVRAGIPYTKKDLPGLICTEHVARTLIELSKTTPVMTALGTELEYKKPWGKTPRQLFDIVARHLDRVK